MNNCELFFNQSKYVSRLVSRLPCEIERTAQTAQDNTKAWKPQYTELRCIALNWTFIHCNILHRTSLHHTAVHHTALHCTALHYIAHHFTSLHCTAYQCSSLHCTALNRTVVHRFPSITPGQFPHTNALESGGERRLQYSGVQCSAKQCSAV